MKMNSISKVILLLVFAVGLVSCGGDNTNKSGKSEGTQIKINTPAGQSWTTGVQGYLPCPANVGMYRNI